MTEPTVQRYSHEQREQLHALVRELESAAIERAFAFGTSAYDQAKERHDIAWNAWYDHLYPSSVSATNSDSTSR